MKKPYIFSLLLIVSSLLLTCSCGKKEEPEPLAVSIPQPPVLEEEIISDEAVYDGIGAFCYYPSDKDGASVPAGTNEICFFFEREDIVQGTGYISIYDSANPDHVYDVIDIKDSEHCFVTPLNDFGKNYTGWESGTMFTLYLDAPFLAGHTYYMDLAEGNFMTEDGSYFSQHFSGKELLCFSVLSYGMIPQKAVMINDFVKGDSVSYQISLGSGAVKAQVTSYDPAIVIPNQVEFEEDSVLTLDFSNTGTSSLSISFYDSDGEVIDSIVYNFRVLL